MAADEFPALQNGVKIEGFSVKHISPTRKKFQRKRFIDLGGDLAVYDAACPEVPTKSFTKINVPGERDEETD